MEVRENLRKRFSRNNKIKMSQLTSRNIEILKIIVDEYLQT